VWYHQHVIGHHAYTNVPGRDPDLYHAPSLSRFSEDLRWRPIHSAQVWSTPFLWLFAVPTLLLIKPLLAIRRGVLNRAVALMEIPFHRLLMHITGRIRALFVFMGAAPR
jgi:delta11-fatty-acid desaturase